MDTQRKPLAVQGRLATEIAVYERLRAELAVEAAGKWVLIRGQEVVGVYATSAEAADAGYEQFGIGPFLVRKVALTDEPLFYPTLHADV